MAPDFEADMRDCICADPENCTQPVPGRRCRKDAMTSPVKSEPTPRTDELQNAAIAAWQARGEPASDEEGGYTNADLESAYQFARTLERELAEMRQYRDECERQLQSQFNKTQLEMARAEAAESALAAERERLATCPQASYGRCGLYRYVPPAPATKNETQQTDRRKGVSSKSLWDRTERRKG